MVKRGDKVWARTYPDGERLLRVWADAGDGVLLTNEAEFASAVLEQREAIVVAFPKSDVRQAGELGLLPK